MASINQPMHRDALPDFRNLGVILRIVLIVLLLTAWSALCRTIAWTQAFDSFLEVVAPVQPVLVVSLLVLWGLSRWLVRMKYAAGIAMVVLLELAIVSVVYRVGEELFPGDPYVRLERYWLFTAAATALILAYFHLRSRALSPALTEARLQALQARIRPHFLFNSINAVLSLIRQEPKRAEGALEDMADLFRVLMADNRDLSTLEREVELTRQYLSLEQLRLGERLRVEWHIENMPGDALIPPLVLQPLVENAVYHGVEPSADPGTVSVRQQDGARQHPRAPEPALRRRGELAHDGDARRLSGAHHLALSHRRALSLRDPEEPHEQAHTSPARDDRRRRGAGAQPHSGSAGGLRGHPVAAGGRRSGQRA
jgi:two-component system sensor histidine kinase AlgZ